MTSSTLSNPLPHLPPLPRRGERSDGLSPLQRRVMVASILAAHVAAVYGLLQVREVRDAAREVAPMFVDLIAPPEPKALPAPPPPPKPQPIPKKPPPAPVIAAAPSPAPAAFVVPPPPPPEPVVETPPVPVVVQAPPAPPAPPPKIIPASAVQYLEPPAPDYPRLSRRSAESGRVVVRVYIDTAGQPHNVQVSASSGFARLDESALSAVQKARFKPYTENGQATAGWTYIPINFELEKS
ncbi:MAG TPA: energy transducer TonB [Burkholderiaceae bacterium]|jgi:protein TonB